MLGRIAAIVVGLLGLAFWGFSVFDMAATLAGYEPYVRDLPAELLAWVQGFPLWRKALWGVNVAAGLLGAMLLPFRLPLAAPLMLAAFVLMLAGFLLDLALLDGAEMYGGAGLIGSSVLTAITLVFAVIAFLLVKKGNPTPA